MNKDELYFNLITLREKLKRKYISNGRMPSICSDDVLRSIAKEAPRHKEDLLNIPNVGQAFVEKYGDQFMIVLNQYHTSNISTKALNEEVKNTLKNLENRLVNISKKNRLLYMGKIYNKFAFDLFTSNSNYNENIIRFLFNKEKTLKLCNIDSNKFEAEKRYKKITPLLREITKDVRENGQYDLYIGYPFVVGRTKGEDFSVRAPLLLFPVNFNKDDSEITLTIDKSKDVLFNNNLILMQNKFLQKNLELPNNVYENVSLPNLMQDLVSFYLNNGIDLTQNNNLEELKNFIDMRVEDFPKFNSGEFVVESNAVLGKFSQYSSALQRDFKNLIDDTEINEVLDDLVSGLDQIDFYTEKIDIEENKNKELKFLEKNINYINDLNSSQEQAILSIDNSDKLVIQGPPGTGKSQTIASLIADSVNKGHNVLMVSQKKAALDVIYSRLGDLSKYAVMLNDVKDKQNFYKQIYNLFSTEKVVEDVEKQFNETAEDIDSNIETLEKLANVLYSNKESDVEMVKIYQENLNNSFKDSKLDENFFYNNLTSEILSIPYLDLVKIRNKFNNETNLKACYNYINIFANLPFIVDLKPNLKTIDIKQMERDFDLYFKAQSEYLSKNIFSKMFKHLKRKKETENLFKKYFVNSRYLNLIYKQPKLLTKVAKCYYPFQTSTSIYDSLTKNEVLYIKTLHSLHKLNSELATNTNLFDFIIFDRIKQFEYDNYTLLSNISNFPNLIKQTVKLMDLKKNLTKTKFKNKLIHVYYKEIYQSKRYNEMQRQIESNRKWNVSKFVKKYGFELFRGIKIWLMTPESVSEILPLEKGLFDLLIFDEASQIYIEKGIPAISRTKKVVIAGDHKQLRPSSLGFGRIDFNDEEIEEEVQDSNAALEEESLLDLARFKYPSVLLNYHYRSKYEELINFSNYAFYDGRLNVSPNTEELSVPPIEVIKIDNGFFIKRQNESEAKKVVQTIKKFLKNRENNETLGVITFNSNQRDLILDELDKECLKDKEFSLVCHKEFDRKENGEDVGLFVKNIENVQGDERDCIIFSIGYAKNETGKVVRNFGWLNQRGGENRLNVAISRAKQKIYVITSIYPEELYVDDLKSEGPKILRKYLEYCFSVSDKNKENTKRILLSFSDEKKNLTENELNNIIIPELIENLKSKGIKVETLVGVGKYKIDVALKYKNKYLLGIDCDSKLYGADINTRERDIYKQQYLESRGWKIYRLWSSNWWHDSEKEVEKILKIYKTLSENV